jgi:hypothetical protein
VGAAKHEQKKKKQACHFTHPLTAKQQVTLFFLSFFLSFFFLSFVFPFFFTLKDLSHYAYIGKARNGLLLGFGSKLGYAVAIFVAQRPKPH